MSARVGICRCFVALVLGVAAASVQAESLPAAGHLDQRIRTATYDENEVYRLYGVVGYAIELIFEPGETFEGEGGGDLDGISIGAHTNHVILKPKAVNVGTNLVLYTNRRAYRLEYSASARTEDVPDLMYAVRFVYPAAPVKVTAPSAQSLVQKDFVAARQARPHNLDYWYCGDASLKPVAAVDDGVQTRLTFGARSDLPAIFLANADGSESLLNFSIEGGEVVIQRVAARFIVRRGKLTGCIVNRAFSGGGSRLSSGTIAPGVERVSRGAAP